jgi:hypothetical protein
MGDLKAIQDNVLDGTAQLSHLSSQFKVPLSKRRMSGGRQNLTATFYDLSRSYSFAPIFYPTAYITRVS